MEDYLQVLERRIEDSEKREYAQVHAWRAENDERRGDSPPPAARSAREVANLEALAQDFQAGEGGRLLMGAEALRQLGRFGEALRRSPG